MIFHNAKQTYRSFAKKGKYKRKNYFVKKAFKFFIFGLAHKRRIQENTSLKKCQYPIFSHAIKRPIQDEIMHAQ